MLFPDLAKRIKATYEAAIKANQILITETELFDVEDEEMSFEVRLLENFTKPLTNENPGRNQFEPPYDTGLEVAEDSVALTGDATESFVLLLNKYSVIPRHFLLITKQFKPQSAPLSPAELVAAYSILLQLGKREKHLAFYNCGANSGASQPHKHIQFIPLANGVAPIHSFIASNHPENTKAPFLLPLPYACFTALLTPPAAASPDVVSNYLSAIFFSLLDAMIDSLRRLSMMHPEDQEGGTTTVPAPQFKLSDLSYNVVMTDGYLMMIPRRKERADLKDGTTLSLNSLAFAWMIMVRNKTMLKSVQDAGVLELLTQVAYESI